MVATNPATAVDMDRQQRITGMGHNGRGGGMGGKQRDFQDQAQMWRLGMSMSG